MVQTADGSPEGGAGSKDDDMSNPMWVHILRLLDDEEQATMVHQIFKQAMITRAIETDLTDRDRAEHAPGFCFSWRAGSPCTFRRFFLLRDEIW